MWGVHRQLVVALCGGEAINYVSHVIHRDINIPYTHPQNSVGLIKFKRTILSWLGEVLSNEGEWVFRFVYNQLGENALV